MMIIDNIGGNRLRGNTPLFRIDGKVTMVYRGISVK
jgi:hypothetical protein